MKQLFLLAISLNIALSITADAHSMYQSAVVLDLHANAVDAELQLPVDRLSISFRQPVDAQYFPAERNALMSYVLAHVHPVTEDNREFAVDIRSMEIKTIENAPYLVTRLVFAPPKGASTNRFTLNYDVITHEIVTHVVLVSIRSDDSVRIQPADPLLLGIIRGPRKSISVDRTKLPL